MLPGTSRARRLDFVGSAVEPVLVAGAGGFIGANLVRELAGRRAAVHALVRPTTSLAFLDGLAGEVTVHRADAADPRALGECLHAVRPGAVVNLMRTRVEAAANPLAPVRDNVVAAANLVVAAAAAGCGRFVQFGSSTEHAARPGPLDESTPIEPATLHGATKAAATFICRELAKDMGIPLVVLRPFHVYGPWDEPGHLVPTAISAALDGRELVLAPGGRRDWVFVADVVEACLLTLNSDLDGEDLNLGGGRQWSNEDVVAAIAEISGRELSVRIDERAARPWDRDDWVADVSKARSLLGWEPRHDLRSGLEETLAWERRRRARRDTAVPRVSVVIPVYRNADTLRELKARLERALGPNLQPRELIFVNDACDAGSGEVLLDVARADESVAVVDHDTNLGQHAAVLTGLERSRGEWTVVLDADLQDPPEAIPRLLAAAAPGTEAVFAGRRGEYEPWSRLLTGRAYRRLLRIIAGTPVDAGIFVALSRRMVTRVLEMRDAMPHRPPQIVAMIGCAGLETASLPVERGQRPTGDSAYSSARRVRSAVQALAWATAWRRHGYARVDDHNAAQRRYFERGAKSTMVPRDSRYLNRHIDELLPAAQIAPGDRVLEVGCGMGRYTLLLAERGIRVEGLDLSPFLLDRLAEFDAGRHRIPLHCADVLSPPDELLGAFDAVIGLFALHHMHQIPRSLRSVARLLRPGGHVAFCEPNPYNPLYYVQIATRPGMTWEGDGGIVKIRRRPIMRALAIAGFGDLSWRRFGFFPPFLADSPVGGLERPLEAFPLWRGALPFQIFGGRLTTR